jgi:hypothetical protein
MAPIPYGAPRYVNPSIVRLFRTLSDMALPPDG